MILELNHPSLPSHPALHPGSAKLREQLPKAKARAKARASLKARARARPASSQAPTQTATRAQVFVQKILRSGALLTSSRQPSQTLMCSSATRASPRLLWRRSATVVQVTDAGQWLYQPCVGLSACSSVPARKRRGMSPITRHNTDSHSMSVPNAASWLLHKQHEGLPPQPMLQHPPDPLAGQPHFYQSSPCYGLHQPIAESHECMRALCGHCCHVSGAAEHRMACVHALRIQHCPC